MNPYESPRDPAQAPARAMSQTHGARVQNRLARMLLASLLFAVCCGIAIILLYSLCVRQILCVDSGCSLLIVYACLLPAVVASSRIGAGLAPRCCLYSCVLGTLAWILKPSVTLGSRQESLSFALGQSVFVVAVFLAGGILGAFFWATSAKPGTEEAA